MVSWRFHTVLLNSAVLCLLLGGCQTTAPIHVWSLPVIDSAVGKRVAVAPLVGDKSLTRALHAAMLQQQPREPGREVIAIDARTLEDSQQVRLASATQGEPSDIALIHLARRSDIDWVLQGEVIAERGQPRNSMVAATEPGADLPPAFPKGHDGEPQADPNEKPLLRVSWKLIDVTGGTSLGGQPLVTHREPGQSTESLISAAADQAWQLVTPHVQLHTAQLRKPKLSLGSSDVRRGNDAAAQGQWQQAEKIWREVLQRRPRQHAAMHNLAIAAVARQDFPQARELIAQAIRTGSSPLYQHTAVWIEQRQRAYHAAFGLSEPQHGWAATSR